MSNTVSKQSVQAGACMIGGSLVQCALEATECFKDNDESVDNVHFLSSRQLQTQPGAHGGTCIERDDTESVRIGMCITENTENNSFCTSSETSCPNGEFDEDVDACSILQDVSAPNGAYSLYGQCDDVCVWSAKECTTGTFQNATEARCSCEQVQTGACVYNGVAYCAVSEAACDDVSTWEDAASLRTNYQVDCRLCREFDQNPPEDVPLKAPGNNLVNTNSDNSTKKWLLGGIMGGLGAIGCLMLMWFLMIRKQQRQHKDSSSAPHPPSEITTDHALDESDDIPELSNY